MKTITTPQGKVVVDESPKNKNWFIPINNFYIDDCNCIRKSLTNNVEYWAVRKNYYEILVSINVSLHKDLPMVIVGDEIEKDFQIQVSKVYEGISKEFFREDTAREWHKKGFEASQQKGVYSEAQLRKAIGLSKHVKPHHVLGEVAVYSTDEIIQSLNQEPIELGREEKIAIDGHTVIGSEIKTTRSFNGQLMAYLKK